METVAVVGVGLIGASFGLALRRGGFTGRIIGVSSPKAIEAGLTAGAISEAANLQDAVREADLIYLAQPVEQILQTLEVLGALVKPGCLVTDAGSTKAAIVKRAADCLGPGTFLGGHPIAGKEQRGAEAAETTLFRNRPYVLTPTGEMTPQMREFQELLVRLETRIVQMSAFEHDNVIALTSHLPQLLSTALSVTLAEQGNPRIQEVSGSGLLDMTRLAISSPDIWASILDTNRSEIVSALHKFIERVSCLADILESDRNVNEAFGVGRRFALEIRNLTN